MPTEKISFDHELSRGIVAYNERVGTWWRRQAADPIHGYAYRNIADFIRTSYGGSPELIVDYACGAGNLLSRLHRSFPDSHLMGLDGSSYLLGLARNRMARESLSAQRRVNLIETLLPDFALPRAVADLVVFVFPNMIPCSGDDDGTLSAHHLNPADLVLARELAHLHDPESCRDQQDPHTLYTTMILDRLVSLNMRRLLKPGGTCMRVEYGNVPREQLPRIELLRTAFEEGSLDHSTNGYVADQWFRVLASRYYRSGVMEDVYHQSGDDGDRIGGYFITVLSAI